MSGCDAGHEGGRGGGGRRRGLIFQVSTMGRGVLPGEAQGQAGVKLTVITDEWLELGTEFG